MSLEQVCPNLQSLRSGRTVGERCPDLPPEVGGCQPPPHSGFFVFPVSDVKGHGINGPAFGIRLELPEKPFVAAVLAAKPGLEAIPRFLRTATDQFLLEQGYVLAVEEFGERLSHKRLA